MSLLLCSTRVPCLSGEAGVAGLQEFEGFRLCMSTARLGTCLLEPCCMYTVSFGACLLFEVSHVYFLCFGMFSNICQPRLRSRQWSRGTQPGTSSGTSSSWRGQEATQEAQPLSRTIFPGAHVSCSVPCLLFAEACLL